MRSYQDLDVYQRASTLFPRVYKMVRTWTIADQRELGSQIIRAANSIHANIAEGWGKTAPDFRRYLGNSLGSCDELRSHFNDAFNVGLMTEVDHKELIGEYGIVGKQLNKLKQNWR
ncbi:four helix bundle protein [Candidatus Kaiserbacteria bacterium]|nr:four helix bundle protein [Candidatus Kaiserbacteria bacterium]